jgi:uncharacterized protein
MKAKGIRGVTIMLGAWLWGCAASPSPPSGVAPAASRPALWKVADEDTSVYLFGTIHLLPENTQWRTPLIDEALEEADALVVEVLMPDDPVKMAEVMTRLGTSPGLPPLIERVPQEKREALRRLIKDVGFPEAALDKMETWAAAITLASISLIRMGYDPALGVEKELTRNYDKARKPILGLETVEQQLGFFDKLSEKSQREFLAGAVDDPAAAKAQFEAMLKSWLTGDVKGIAKTFDTETSLSGELRDVLMRRRNAAWADWVQRRLQQPGIVFLAVGAGHLAGADSLQELLEDKGMRARRLQ